MAKKPTQKQVAEMAGVSQSIVSKVLRGQSIRGMSKEKVKAIQDAAEKLGYALPGQEKAQPKAPPKPPAKPRVKFAATPSGDPLHKYGKQWKTHVARATGLMPSGAFTDLKYGEQKQVMGVLNSIDKDGKKRTKTTEKNYKLNKASRQIWKGVAIGAGAVGVPLTMAGVVNKLVSLIGDTAQTARQGATLGIDADKLVAMSRRAEVFGVQGEEFTNSLRSVQTLMTNLTHGVSDQLMENLKKYAIHADVAKLQAIANKGTATDFIKELYGQFRAGKISRKEIVELLGQSGAGALTELFTGGKLMDVLSAKPIEGAAQAAIELDQTLGKLKLKFEDVFIKNFPAIEAGLDKFSDWLDTADFTTLTSLMSDFGDAITFVIDKLPFFKTTRELVEERQKLISRKESGKYFSGLMSIRLDEINKDLAKRGINPEKYNAAAKQNADKVQTQKSQPQKVEHVHRHEIAIKAETEGTLTDQQFTSLESEIKKVIERYMKTEEINITEKYS